jgi:hypothetical protein
VLTRLGIPSAPAADTVGPVQTTAQAPATPNPESQAGNAAAVLPDLGLGWNELMQVATEAGYTTVRQRHVTEPSTDHELRVITIPLTPDK